MSINFQQTFDYVANAIINQGVPSMTEQGVCRYRGTNGTKCAAGWLIPDDVYTPAFEGQIIQELSKSPDDIVRNWVSQFTEDELHFLYSLQIAHDHAAIIDDRKPFVEAFREELQVVANNYNLVNNFGDDNGN